MREMVDELLTERENKKELRNDHDPDSQPYAIYDRQQAAVKVIMNCFTPDTEVLTPQGIRISPTSRSATRSTRSIPRRWIWS